MTIDSGVEVVEVNRPDRAVIAVGAASPTGQQAVSALRGGEHDAVVRAVPQQHAVRSSRQEPAQPIGVLALGILDIIPTPDGAGLMNHYRDACPAGSALAVSNGAQLTLTQQQVHEIHALMSDSSTPSGHWRTREEVAELLAGYELLEPGVVPTAAWRPNEPVRGDEAARSNAYGAVGLLPHEH